MHLAITHFNNLTYNENLRWRESNNINCIYGLPVKLQNKILPFAKIYVIEMNNSSNKVEGVGLIKAFYKYDKKYKIYSEMNYNRYIVHSKHWLSRDCFDDYTLEKLEKRLFFGKHHLKRGQGILIVPNDVCEEYFDFIKSLFNLLTC